jgi:peptidoglycan/xylan/chitin deacetylase (PgdA/CDA1 family)
MRRVWLGVWLLLAIAWDCSVVAESKKLVILTIDDGPSTAFVEKVSKTLKQYHASATFFCIGKNIQADPSALKLIHQNGFEIGNHSFSHRNLTRLSDKEIKAEINRTSDLINQITGLKPTYFRPPGGAYNQRVKKVIESTGLKMAMWTIDPKDWRGKNGPNPKQTVNYITRRLSPGAIILLHEKRNTLKALPILLKHLDKQGYQAVSLSKFDQLTNQAATHKR